MAKRKKADGVLFEKDSPETKRIKADAKRLFKLKQAAKEAREKARDFEAKLIDKMKEAKLNRVVVDNREYRKVDEEKAKIVSKLVEPPAPAPAPAATGKRPKSKPAGPLEEIERTRSGKPRAPEGKRTATIRPKRS